MKIKIWGTRGSIAVSGPKYIKYGGNTPCVEVRFNDGNIFIIDAGTGIRELGETLTEEDLSKEIKMTITHSHWDHIQGFPFFTPIYLKGTRIEIRGCLSVTQKLNQILSTQMEKTYFPVPLDTLPSEIKFTDVCVNDWMIGDALIKTIEVNHPNLCHAVKIIERHRINTSNEMHAQLSPLRRVHSSNVKRRVRDRSFVFMTDNELGQNNPTADYGEIVEFVRDADYLIHDTMYLDEEISQKRGWGHSSIGEAAKLAIDANVKNLGLYHHDPTRTDAQVDEMVVRTQQILKDNRSNTLCFATYDRQEFIL